MSDISCRLYGAYDLRVEDMPEPEAMGDTAIIRILRGAICAVDMQHYEKGGIGANRISSPLIPGCQASGIVESAPTGSGLVAGQIVALSPSRPCETCGFCEVGLYRHCLNMRFNGSSTRYPYEDGFFRSRLAHPVKQCLPVAEGLSAEAATGVEPLAACLHALSRAPSLEGQRVLIRGAGFMGTVCAALARLRGASDIVVTDIRDLWLDLAQKMGADRTINVMESFNGLGEYMTNNGQFDVVFECSANAHSVAQSIRATRPQGTIVQIGIPGTMPIAMNLLIAKELHMHGAFRFDTEFPEALDMVCTGKIDLSPLISHVLPATDAKHAFELAIDRDHSLQVQLDFAA